MIGLVGKSKTPKKKHFKFSIKKLIMLVVAIVLLSSAFMVSAANWRKAAEYKQQTKDAVEQCEQAKQEIEKANNLINGKGFDEYCEKIAREKYGYVKPGEYVICDSSFGN